MAHRGSHVQAQKTLSELERAIAEARKQCDEATAGECAAAWDTVEELSAAISHKKAQVCPAVRFCVVFTVVRLLAAIIHKI